MPAVDAFVGHSFAEDDEAVVTTFLELFRTFSDTREDFNWDHARKAESKTLSEKVLEKIEGKNTFIGICTRKEKIIKSTKNIPFLGFLLLKSTDTEWKTSDWLIQEIGLAIGRNLQLILFIEEGVRRPGGLQGDVEYIPFNRANPEQSFTRFMQMYKSISPTKVRGMVTSSDEGVEEETEAEPSGQEIEEFWTPRDDWQRRDYERAMFYGVLLDNKNIISQIDLAYRATDEGKISENVAVWDAYCESIKIIHGSGGDFSNLNDLASQYSKNANILVYQARVFHFYKNFEKAAEVYRKAADVADNKSRKIKFLKEVAINYQSNEDPYAVLQVANQIRQDSDGDASVENDALNALQEIYDNAEMHTLRLCTLERISEIDPSNSDRRYTLAYEHFEHGSDELSLYHYSLIGPKNRSASAWNNLGAAYARFGLQVSAVRAFQRSKAMNETLAMSNLAYRYMDAGFLEEARKECDQAIQIPDYNTNINAALTRIEELPSEEAKKETEIIEKARRKSEFLQNFGHALLGKITVQITGNWQHPNSDEALLELNGDDFQAVVSYEQPLSRLSMAFSGLPLRASRVTLRYQGNVHGRGLECTITHEAGQPKTATLLASDSTRTALMYLSDDNDEWLVMENPFGTYPTFYSLTRQET